MFPQDSDSAKTAEKLRVLEDASDAPDLAYQTNPEVREAFDEELRKLAEDIVQFHPSLTQLLLSMGDPSLNPVHGKN